MFALGTPVQIVARDTIVEIVSFALLALSMRKYVRQYCSFFHVVAGLLESNEAIPSHARAESVVAPTREHGGFVASRGFSTRYAPLAVAVDMLFRFMVASIADLLAPPGSQIFLGLTSHHLDLYSDDME